VRKAARELKEMKFTGNGATLVVLNHHSLLLCYCCYYFLYVRTEQTLFAFGER
jgi:hypothetical protein